MKKPNNHYFQVRRSGIHGHGGFALRRIRKGTRIIEYAGERISQKEADRRQKDNGTPHYHTVQFTVDENICIDAGRHGNAARFINHSCDPNCDTVNDGGHIFIEAIRNIQPGVELTYDYWLTGAQPRTKSEREFYACRCGSSNCRGTMCQKPSARKRRSARKR